MRDLLSRTARVSGAGQAFLEPAARVDGDSPRAPSARGTSPSRGTLRPVVYLPTWLSWDVMRQRPQSLLAALASTGHPVYFVDPRERAVRTDGGVTIVPSLRATPQRSALLYVHHAPSRGPAAWFADSALIYDVLDDLSMYALDEQGSRTAVQTATHHPHLLRSADVVIAASKVLADGVRVERPDVLLVENGVDPSRFNTPHPRPSGCQRVRRSSGITARSHRGSTSDCLPRLLWRTRSGVLSSSVLSLPRCGTRPSVSVVFRTSLRSANASAVRYRRTSRHSTSARCGSACRR